MSRIFSPHFKDHFVILLDKQLTLYPLVIILAPMNSLKLLIQHCNTPICKTEKCKVYRSECVCICT